MGCRDVNWAAIGLDIARDDQVEACGRFSCVNRMFWRGGMPTQLVTKRSPYQPGID